MKGDVINEKIVIGVLAGVVLLRSASFVAAGSNGNGFINFKEMKPFIEQMHPNLSPEQQEKMFNACHGEDGLMQNSREYQGLMNNL